MKTPLVLDKTLKCLNLRIEESWVQIYIDQLYSELEEKGIKFRPHIWISDEWFSPDGVPGFAIPFYILRRDLRNIYRDQVGELEGATPATIMKLLRHEAGHAIDNAYRLKNRIGRKLVFGDHSEEYPSTYTYRRNFTEHVNHLSCGYAQSHPCEDFAETFAVWLDPDSDWQNKYKNREKVLNKLIWMDSTMKAIGKLKPSLKNLRRVDPIDKSDESLRFFLQRKRKETGINRFRALNKIMTKSNEIDSQRHTFLTLLNEQS